MASPHATASATYTPTHPAARRVVPARAAPEPTTSCPGRLVSAISAPTTVSSAAADATHTQTGTALTTVSLIQPGQPGQRAGRVCRGSPARGPRLRARTATVPTARPEPGGAPGYPCEYPLSRYRS